MHTVCSHRDEFKRQAAHVGVKAHNLGATREALVQQLLSRRKAEGGERAEARPAGGQEQDAMAGKEKEDSEDDEQS